jgi:hypothetical protein
MNLDWFTGGASIIAVLFVLNTVVYVLRGSGRRASPDAGAPLMKRPQSCARVTGSLALAAVLVACFAVPVVAPGSDLGKALAAPWAVVAVLLWAMAIAVVVAATAFTLARRRRRSSGRG